MKKSKIYLLLLSCFLFPPMLLNGQYFPLNTVAWGDQTYWKNDAGSGNWNANNWYDQTQGWDNHNPNYEGGRNLIFDNNNQLTMTNDFTGVGLGRWQVTFESTANQSRTISGTTENTFYDNGGTKPKIQNNSSVNHTISFPIKLGYNPLELNPVNGNLTITSAINTNGNVIDVYGTNNKSLILTGNISGIGGITVKQSSKLVLSSNNKSYTGATVIEAGTLEISVNLSSSVTVKNGASLIVNGDCTIPGLTIESGGMATINAGKSLTVSGTLSNSAGTGGLILKSDGTYGSASLIHNTSSIAGTVERYFTGAAESWHFLSSPVASQEISGVFTPSGTYGDGTGYDFYTWYETATTWVNKKNTTVAPTWTTANGNNNFAVGRGYLVAYQATNPTKSFTGNLNNGAIDYALTKSGTGSYAAYNLAGNPYPSAIDWKAALGWTRTNLVINSGYDMWIYYQSAGNYGVYNSGSSGDAGTNGATRYIAVGQGFMVKALSSGNLSMANEIRIAQNPSFLKGISNESNIFSMQVTNTVNNFSDEIRIEFGHATGDGGAEKMFSFEIKSPGMFIPKGSNKYSIDFRGEPQSVSIPVSFIPGTDGQHVITADVTSFPLGTTIYLEDLQENRNQDLTANSSYSFDALKGDNENRFILHFGGTFDINEHSELPDYTVYSVDKSVMIIGKPGKKANGQVTVYNLIGQIVGHSVFSGDQTLRMNLNVPSGHYLVNIISSEKTQTSKVFIR